MCFYYSNDNTKGAIKRLKHRTQKGCIIYQKVCIIFSLYFKKYEAIEFNLTIRNKNLFII